MTFYFFPFLGPDNKIYIALGVLANQDDCKELVKTAFRLKTVDGFTVLDCKLCEEDLCNNDVSYKEKKKEDDENSANSLISFWAFSLCFLFPHFLPQILS